MKKPKKSKKPKYRVAGLVAAGLFSVVVGLVQMIRPAAYVSMGGTGQYAKTMVTSVYAGNDARFTAFLILFKGCFLLTVAYRIKKLNVRKRHKNDRTESVKDTLNDTQGTPWENDQDHTDK